MNNLKDYIITEADDQDVYKFSMQHFYWFNDLLNINVEWALYNRGKIVFPEGFGEALQYQVDHMKDVVFTEEILENLRVNYPYFYPDYINKYLRNFKYKPENIIIEDNGQKITVKGTLGETTFWETQLMAMMSELYNFMMGHNEIYDANLELNNKNDIDKFLALERLDVPIIEFGMRRRFSKHNQHRVLLIAQRILGKNLIGTSNVMFGRILGLLGKGTIAHEVPMLYAALNGTPVGVNNEVLEKWYECYAGSLGLALPDTFTTNKFLEELDPWYANNYIGLRQDSGDPFGFTSKYANYCSNHKIKAEDKSIVYSDSINNVPLVKSLKQVNIDTFHFNISFGIGTWFTNDLVDIIPVNWVIKLTRVFVNGVWVYTAKLSDTPGKITTLDMPTAERYKEELNIKEGDLV